MSDNKSCLSSQEMQRSSVAFIHCEVLRGAFKNADGHIRHGRVDLPSGHAVSAGSADPAPVLLVNEDGDILDVLGKEFPALAILRVPMSPLHPAIAAAFLAPRYDALEIKTFAMLRSLLRRAIRDAEAPLLGQVATASARIHQRRLPKPRFDVLLNIAVSFGACGLSVSHGGSGAALIFNPKKRDFYRSMQGATWALRELGICRDNRLTGPGTAASLRGA